MEKKVLMAALVIIGVVVLIAGCYSILNSKNRSNEYVFVEHYVETQGFLADDPEVNAYVYMGYPTYNSTTSQNLLKATWFPPLNKSLRVMLGNGKGIGKEGCHGGEMYLYGAYELPYKKDNITIKRVDRKGTVYLDYNGESLVLNPGDIWYNNSSRIEIIHFTNSTVDENVKVNISVMDRIRNFGIFTKGLD
ncbi:hypothetical protein [Methanosarcina mazei]|uniref:Uncharacterized protein n=2 Tax=Methanosarcina TaxID=2207 RepID=A0A0F8DUG1_METMZ|nr:hypothetical protein [Methanosarcina mazei]KKG06283.1 hypothetical protein DU47_13715 [Methanosarcina mazei]KKH90520.1 hypothetical protein DU80_14530 [Methanosarcina mazei]UWJ23473.1 hypothetical protein MSMAT_2216 [Methanosarcina mazei TMA]BBL64216.1 hypothetical protein MmazTMA_11930 [Methanosarcina mazei]